MTRKLIILMAILIAISIAAGGCYTIIKHPNVEYADQSDEYYQTKCLDCHADYDTFPYGFYYPYMPDYWRDEPNWGRYYAYPWWWESYWRNKDNGDGTGEANAPISSEPPDRRRGLEPPYIWNGEREFDPIQGLNPPSYDGNKTRDDKNTGTDTTTKIRDKEEEPKTKETKTEEKPQRRRLPEKGSTL